MSVSHEELLANRLEALAEKYDARLDEVRRLTAENEALKAMRTDDIGELVSRRLTAENEALRAAGESREDMLAEMRMRGFKGGDWRDWIDSLTAENEALRAQAGVTEAMVEKTYMSLLRTHHGHIGRGTIRDILTAALSARQGEGET